MRPRYPAALLLIATVAFPPTGGAQAVKKISLTAPSVGYAEPFSLIAGVRELPDGRVLVSDGIDNLVLRIDLATGRVDTVGRAGQGPGEYRNPDALFPMPHGRTMLVDLGNARVTVYGPDGRSLDSWSIVRGEPRPGAMLMVLPQAVDGEGRVYFQPSSAGSGLPSDSGQVVRWIPDRDVFDTVARVKLPERKVNASGGPNNRQVSVRPIPYAPSDAWVVAPDGRLAIVSSQDYHVEWIQVDGTRVRGRPVSVRPVPIGEPEKAAWRELLSSALSVGIENNNGETHVSMSRGRPGRPRGRSQDDLEWPASLPPFRASGVWIAPTGALWVERSVAAGAARVYDIFGADGNLQSQVVLPRGRVLLGFGASGMYARWLDDSDLQFLERYPMPS